MPLLCFLFYTFSWDLQYTLHFQLRPAVYVAFFFLCLLHSLSLNCVNCIEPFFSQCFFSPKYLILRAALTSCPILPFLFNFCYSLPYSIPPFVSSFLPKLGSLTSSVSPPCHPFCSHFFNPRSFRCVFPQPFLSPCITAVLVCVWFLCLWRTGIRWWLYLLLLSYVCLPSEAKMLFITVSV